MAQVRPFGTDKSKDDPTIPRSGTVQSVCRQWSVHEDEGLAHRLQENEFKSHFSRNKEYHRTVQGDIKEAKKTHCEELAEIERRHARHKEQLKNVEERDRELAEHLQAMILEEEMEINHCRRQRDQALALALQEEEKLRSERPSDSRVTRRQPSQEEELRFEAPVRPPRRPSAPATTADNDRKLQELRDEELARRLQEEEETQASRDYRLAMESQDAEYAQVLAEKEKERARRAKERHRAQQELLNQDEQRTPPMSSPPMESAFAQQRLSPTGADRFGFIANHNPQGLDNNLRRFRAQHDAEVELARNTNVITTIDPTYKPSKRSPVSAHATTSPVSSHTPLGSRLSGGRGASREIETGDTVEGDNPPYMPVSGERKVTSLEKGSKTKNKEMNGKSDKDNCKTQ